jgi:hypothetical protein
MTPCRVLAVLVVLLSGTAVCAAGAAVGSPATGSRGRAIEVPGLGTLNKGGVAAVISLSCASPGSCAAGGVYADAHRNNQGFVAVERKGRWGHAIEVPGLAALNTGQDAEVSSVSCASAEYCAAGGGYADRGGDQQGFVAIEANGRWNNALRVPGLAALNKGRSAYVSSVSCPSAGNCVAGGNYRDGDRRRQGFVAVERNGRWGKAIEVPGLGTLNTGANARIREVSCASAGNCALGGSYKGGTGHQQGFVAMERNSRWGKAIGVPGLRALNKGGVAEVRSLSCAPAGGCAAGGAYTDSMGDEKGFVAVERRDHWRRAIKVPGLAAMGFENTAVDSVSCAAAGNCAAGGDDSPYGLGFVVSEKNGVWGRAREVPGLRGLATGAQGRAGATVTTLSCGSADHCAAAGYYSGSAQNLQGFVTVRRYGRWTKAIEVPGLRALNTGGGVSVSEVSCAPVGGCAAGGFYTDRHHHSQGFVVTQTG